MITVNFPKNFYGQNCIPEFLDKAQVLYKYKNTQYIKCSIDLEKIKKISIVGLLLFYKFLEYSQRNKCFLLIELIGNEYYYNQLFEQYGFSDFIASLFDNYQRNPNQNYDKLKFKVGSHFIIAPHALLRQNKDYVNTIMQNRFIPALEKYYTNQRVVGMISGCLGEIIANFWEHAKEDENTLVVAQGSKKSIDIACVDTGNGIISTMRSSPHYKDGVSEMQLFKMALSKEITSKPNTNHMGLGLWLLDEIAVGANGRFHLFSQGFHYANDFGIRTVKKCSYWQGTILYLNLSLDVPVTISEIIDRKVLRNGRDLLLNFE